MRLIVLGLAAAVLAVPAAAQGENELSESIVVTGTRISDSMPGTALTRRGDFLLLPFYIVNDSRDEKLRMREIYSTLQKMVTNAGRARGLELSVLTEGGFVRPLNRENYRIGLSQGGRPDTSQATIHISSRLDDASNPGELIDKLTKFVKDTPVVGRTELIPDVEPEVSIVNPNQYRGEIIALMGQDVGKVMAALGEGYRIQMRGIDRKVEWVRSGLAEVKLYIPYHYDVLPAAEAYSINWVERD